MSAILKNHIETIFDYDLTDDEKSMLVFDQSEQEYISTHNEESINKALMFLFSMRNNSKKASFYQSKLNKDWVKLNIKWDSVQPLGD